MMPEPADTPPMTVDPRPTIEITLEPPAEPESALFEESSNPAARDIAKPRRRQGGRDRAAPRQSASRTRDDPRPTPPAHTAVYRLYDASGTLLYVGQSNAPLERYVEHRDTRPWWPDVAEHSIEWQGSRERAEQREEFAIRDEWPLHNIAHQPRANGLKIPSHVAGRLMEEIRKATSGALPDATREQLDEVIRRFAGALGFGDDRDGIELGVSTAPRTEPLDLDAAIGALGRFRPPIENSTRAAEPRYRRQKPAADAA